MQINIHFILFSCTYIRIFNFQVSQELNKIKLKKSGCGTDDVYVSTWQYFDALKFLTPVLTANETKSSLPGKSTKKSTCDVVRKTNLLSLKYLLITYQNTIN